MGLGIFPIDVELDTASDPDDTTLLAAQGERTQIYINWLAVHVYTIEAATELNIEAGVGGNIIGVVPLTVVGTFYVVLPMHHKSDGFPLALNTALNATTIGGQAMAVHVTGECEVRGQMTAG